MIIEDFSTGVKPEKRGILVPILLGCMWFALAVALLWVMAVRYRARMAAVSLSENRFITTEWSLLQELKVQTDAKLLQKDQEIADLRLRYLSLSERNASPDALRRVEISLEEADHEREQIVSAKSAPSDRADASRQALEAGLQPLVDPVRLPELLSAQIRTLQAQLAERRLYAQILEEQLAHSNTVQPPPQPAAEDTTAEQKRLEELLKKLAEAKTAVVAARSQIEKAKLEINATDKLSMEDLNTWTLLRALVSSPEIRVKYPDLLKSMDEYFQAYGNQQRLKGNLEAYSAALKTLESLARQMEGL